AASTLITVPGIGAVRALCSPPKGPAAEGASSSTSGGVCGAGGGRFIRHAPSQGPVGRRAGGADSGAYSERNAVVVLPARTAGCADSQRRKGRVVVRRSTA